MLRAVAWAVYSAVETTFRSAGARAVEAAVVMAVEAAVEEDGVAPVAGRPLELLGDPEDDARRKALWDALR